MRGVGGSLFFATSSAATFATSSKSALTIDSSGFLTMPAAAGVGCAEWDANGKLTNKGSACGTGGSSFAYPFPAFNGIGTTTALIFSASTTIGAGTNITGLTIAGRATTTSLVFSGTTNALLATDASGLVVSTTSIAATLLTGTLPITHGGTGSTGVGNNLVVTSNSNGSSYIGTSDFIWLAGPKWLGVGTTTPQWLVTLATTTAPQLVLQGEKTSAPWAFRSVGGFLYVATTTNTASFATTTMAAFSITSGGEVTTQELDVATTTTTTTIDWQATPNQVRLRIGSAATNIQFINATNSAMVGSRKLVYVCNPPTVSAGAVTWIGVEWIGSTPTQTTTAGQCDVQSFDVTQASSTSATYKVAGSQGSGFQ